MGGFLQSLGKIAITESGEGKHAVAHGERNREDAGDKPAKQIIANFRVFVFDDRYN